MLRALNERSDGALVAGIGMRMTTFCLNYFGN